MLTEPQFTDFRKRTEVFEGRVPYLYLDTRSNPTCGIGHLCATVADAELLPFSGGMGAVAGLVARDWQVISTATPGRVAAFYAGLTTSRLTDEAIDSIFAADCERTWNGILAFLPTLESLPPTVQEAILDMSFNLGIGKEHADYFGPHSKFGPAILRGDWQTAAAESARNGIQPSRNEYTRDLIMAA
jgi:GH24 family phage-related lysozyme (muramidase)